MSEPETPASSDEALEKALQSTIDSLRREFEDRLDEARGEMQRVIDEIQEAEARRREAEETIAAQTDGAPPTLELDQLLQAVAEVDAGATQEEILSALVAGAARFADRSALFLTTDEGLSLWASHGFADAPDAPLELPWKSGRWTALSEGRGAVVLEASDCEAVAEGLAGDHPTAGVAVPLVLRDRIAAALYADRLTEASLQLPVLQILAYSAAQGIETLAWRERLTTPSLRLANGEDSPGLALWDPEWTADGVGVGGSPALVTPPTDGAELDASPPGEEPETEVLETEVLETEVLETGALGAGAPEDEAIEIVPEESLEVDLASLPDADWAATDAEGEGLPEPQDDAGDEDLEGTLAAEGLGLQMEDSPEAPADPEAVPAEAEESLLDGGDRDEDRTWVPVDELAPGGDDAGPPTPEVPGWDASFDSSETPPEPDMDFEMPAEEPVGAATVLEEAPAEIQPDEPEVEETPVPGLEVERTTTPEAEIPVEEAADSLVAGEEMEDEVAETIPAGPPELDARVEVSPPEDLEGPGSAFATPPLAASEDEADLHEDAKRLSRLLVSELMLYNESEIARGRREGNVYSRLADEIDRSREVYEDRIDDRVRRSTDYFREELVRVLAGGDPGVLGV